MSHQGPSLLQIYTHSQDVASIIDNQGCLGLLASSLIYECKHGIRVSYLFTLNVSSVVLEGKANFTLINTFFLKIQRG